MTPFTVPGFMRLAFTIFVGIGFLLLGLGGCNVGEQGGGNPGSGANGTEDTDVNVDADDPTDTGSGVNGADDDDSTTQDNTGTDTGEAGKIIAEPVDDASYLFAPDEIRTYELLLSKADLSFLNSAPAAEEYVEGKLVFEGKTISPVGIRYKGSIGAFGMCTGFGWGPNGGRKTCPKLSMKVKINWEGSDARFYGLKKLQFHSMNTDDSLMREQLGYYAFRAMGVASPRTAHVRLLINGKFEGVFLLVEQIDGCFTRSRFSEGGKGNLYKEIWPVTTRERPYIISLRTNEDENPSVDRPIALAR